MDQHLEDSQIKGMIKWRGSLKYKQMLDLFKYLIHKMN